MCHSLDLNWVSSISSPQSIWWREFHHRYTQTTQGKALVKISSTTPLDLFSLSWLHALIAVQPFRLFRGQKIGLSKTSQPNFQNKVKWLCCTMLIWRQFSWKHYNSSAMCDKLFYSVDGRSDIRKPLSLPRRRDFFNHPLLRRKILRL